MRAPGETANAVYRCKADGRIHHVVATSEHWARIRTAMRLRNAVLRQAPMVFWLAGAKANDVDVVGLDEAQLDAGAELLAFLASIHVERIDPARLTAGARAVCRATDFEHYTGPLARRAADALRSLGHDHDRRRQRRKFRTAYRAAKKAAGADRWVRNRLREMRRAVTSSRAS